VLSVDPGMEVVPAVEDAAAEAEAVRATAQVPPVPESGHGSAQQLRGLTDGEEVGWLVGGGSDMAASWAGRVSWAVRLEKAPFRAVW
jgi:hypothetical protein